MATTTPNLPPQVQRFIEEVNIVKQDIEMLERNGKIAAIGGVITSFLGLTAAFVSPAATQFLGFFVILLGLGVILYGMIERAEARNYRRVMGVFHFAYQQQIEQHQAMQLLENRLVETLANILGDKAKVVRNN